MSFEDIDLQWFAAEDEGRTEEASELKLEKARKEGRVAKSQEVNGGFVFLFSVLTLMLLGKWLLRNFEEILIFFFTRSAQGNAVSGTSAAVFFDYFLKMVLPVAFVALLAGVGGNILQNRRWIFSLKPITPNFSKILPHFGEYFKKTVFSKQGAFNIVKSLAKVAILVFAAFAIIRANMGDLLFIIHQNGNILGAFGKIASIAFKLLFFAAIFFLVISIPDYFVQRSVFLDSLKMTKQEVKEEYKEMEGDPDVKSRIKQAQRQLLASNMPRAVAESDVVITNPTHFAVALKYDVAANDAPMVSAKGEDFMAQRIKEIARENDIPIVENRPLARSLYADVELGAIIPDEYINAVVLVYTHLKKFRKNFGASA
ncbi:MAG: flagellar biosynthesis protein FlhB [Treponema sp.]|nr:flagellar biosynthesis protein FlhB [Treponema sp.]